MNTETGATTSWVDEAWAEASSRKASDRYNVWAGRSSRSLRSVGRYSTLKKALAAAFEHRPARVYDGFVELKVHRMTNPVSLIRMLAVCGELAKVTKPRRLEDVCALAGLQRPITHRRALVLIAAVAAGEVEWKGHTVKLTPAVLELTGTKGEWLVGRVG